MNVRLVAVLLLLGAAGPASAGPLLGTLLPPPPLAAGTPPGRLVGESPQRGERAWQGVLVGGLLVPALVGTGAYFTVAAPVKDSAERLFVSAALGAAAGWVAGPVAVALLSDVRGIVPRVVLGALLGAVLCLPAVFIPVVGWAVLMAGPALGALWAIETAPTLNPPHRTPGEPT